ncbi:MAG: ECF transporter S component [archaeon YNP-WB-040]|nr:ECF transporter S component [Candidatus Culexarchaeum yellowstonense]
MSLAKRVSIIGFMAALTCILTSMFQLYIYETHGYFNFGEIGVYISAILFGPVVGAFAGGLGSAMADVLLGYFWYAPGTLIIKGLEGFAVGLVYSFLNKLRFKRSFIGCFSSSIIAIIIFSSLLHVGLNYYSGSSEFSFGFPLLGYGTVSIGIPSIFWALTSMLLLIIFIYIYVKVDLRYLSMALSCLVGGSVMILGYFLYEFYVLSYGWAALVEVPFNFMQMLIGLIVSSIICVGIGRRGIMVGV